MRAVRVLTGSSGVSADRLWLPGLPHALAGVAPYFVVGTQACVTGLLLATLASFIIYLPVAALSLNSGRPIASDAPAPVLTARMQILLLALWTLTAWSGAGLSAMAA